MDDISKEVREIRHGGPAGPVPLRGHLPGGAAGSVETLAHALELRLEERRLRCWVGFAERAETDGGPADLVTRAATALAEPTRGAGEAGGPDPEHETVAFPAANGRARAA